MRLVKSTYYTFLFILSCSSITAIYGQDTLEVIALTYDTTSRNVMVDFPTEGQFRKIEMLYSMRCHDLAVGNGSIGCREWDYSCNTVITVPERQDSLKRVSPDYTISNVDASTFTYSNSPTYTYTQYNQKATSIGNPTGIDIFTVGSGAMSPHTFSDESGILKSYMLWTADEMLASGIGAGQIYGITVDALASANLPYLKIKAGTTTADSLLVTRPVFDNLEEVFFSDINIVEGSNQLVFYEAVDWNGEDNILFELSYEQSADPLTLVSDTSNKMSLVTTEADGFVEFTGVEAFDLEMANLDQVSGQVTFSFWSYGSPNLPQNTTAFEGVDANNARQANVHLPWSDSNIYWDCGNDGSGYDRTSKLGLFTDYKNVWTHWTFIKDVEFGYLKILKNGTNYITEYNKFKSIDLQRLVFGANINGSGGFQGYIDDFRVWNAALDQVTVQNYMYRDIDSTHPFYDNLLGEYRLNTLEDGTIYDSSTHGGLGVSDDLVKVDYQRSVNLRKNYIDPGHRPMVGFIQGNVNVNVEDVIVMDSIVNSQHQVIQYGLDDSELIVIDTMYYYPGGEQSIFNEAGSLVGSISGNADGTITIGELTHYIKSDARYEITSFVTPYGNGLDLGPNGKTFTMDVTDFLPILKGQRQLTIEGVGNNQEEMDIRFRFITGTPVADVLDIKQLWPIRGAANIWSGYGFSNIKNDDVFEPRTLTLDPEADSYKLRSAITGHGSNGEFTNQSHYLDLNGGFKEFQYNVWKECADNPMYPQGGTWIFDRAGWCPGMETDIHQFSLSDWIGTGETVEIDYGLVGVDPGAADYRISNQLVTYGPKNFETDVEVFDILRPTSKFEYDRFNPACNSPAILVRNNGTSAVNSIIFEYGLEEGSKSQYEWTGVLTQDQVWEVELPVYTNSMWSGNTAGQFTVEILSVDGILDGNPDNDVATSQYNPVFEFERNFRLEFKADNQPSDNSYSIFNSAGEEVLKRSGFQANSSYSDILDLPGGCYTLDFRDTGDDGLEFWFFASNGIGTLRFDEMKDDDTFQGIAYQFDPDFGGGVSFDFMVRGTTGVNDVEDASLLSISPNPASQYVEVNWQHEHSDNGRLVLSNMMGQELITLPIKSKENLYLDTSEYETGSYLLSIQHSRGIKTEIIQIVN